MKKLMPWTEKINIILKELNISQKTLAEKTEVNPPYINEVLKGKNQNPSVSFVSALAHLGISCRWLLKDEGAVLGDDGVIGIPLYDIQASAGAGSVVDFLDNPSIITWLDIRKEVIERYGDKQIGAVRVYGDSMMPTYHSGDIAVFAVDLIDGDGVYLLGLDNAVFIKRLQFLPERNQIIVKSDNPAYEPRVIDAAACQVYFKIIGRVVGTYNWD